MLFYCLKCRKTEESKTPQNLQKQKMKDADFKLCGLR